MKKIGYILVLLLVTVIPAAAGSHYTLRDLCQAANKNAESIKISYDDVAIAEQEKKRALSVLIPRATSFGSFTEYRNPTQSSPSTATLGVKLTQSFTLNGKELIAYDVTKKGIERSEFSLESVRSDYLLQVAQAYLETLSAERLLEIADADVQRLDTHKQSVQEQLSVGSVTKTDLYRAEAELSRSMTDRVVADNGLIQNRARIVRLAGIKDDFSISAKDIRRFDDFSPSLADIQESALANRYEIKEAEKAVEIATRTIEYEKGDFWPELSLDVGYQESDIDYDTSYGTSSEYDTEEAYVSAELVFTLYDGGLRRAEVRQAEAQERQAKEALTAARNDIILESKVAFSEYESARTALINLQDELKSAQENYNAVQMQFKYGMADSIDMMDANTLLVQAERRISNAEYTLYQAILQILYTRGELLSYLLD